MRLQGNGSERFSFQSAQMEFWRGTGNLLVDRRLRAFEKSDFKRQQPGGSNSLRSGPLLSQWSVVRCQCSASEPATLGLHSLTAGH
jgi:hypothetical protein